MDKLKNYRNNPKTFQIFNDFIDRLNIGLKRLENDIKNISEDEVGNKTLNYLRDVVRTIVDGTQKLDDMPDLESEESATERQQG